MLRPTALELYAMLAACPSASDPAAPPGPLLGAPGGGGGGLPEAGGDELWAHAERWRQANFPEVHIGGCELQTATADPQSGKVGALALSTTLLSPNKCMLGRCTGRAPHVVSACAQDSKTGNTAG